MKIRRTREASLTLSLALMIVGPNAAPADDRPTVIVELFTSQGCSSCPPADLLLTQLGNGGAPAGVRVIPLSFHVDYWDYIGWKDPFSSPEWSKRQRRYARALRLDTVYTPQLVIQGGAELVGSQEAEVHRQIEHAAEQESPVLLSLSVDASTDDMDSLAVTVEAKLNGTLPDRELHAMVALFEENLETPVERGENARRTLRNDFVVRELRLAFVIHPKAIGTEDASAVFELEPGWNRDNLGLAAFVQDPKSMQILGAAVTRPSNRPQ